jgi:hypothetical protein
MLDYSYVVLGVLALFTVLGMAYYATRIMLQMRTGELEKSWRYLLAAAYLVEAAVSILLISAVFFEKSFTGVLITHVAVTLLVVGGFYTLLGFRAHYKVFSPRYPDLEMKDIIEK